MDQAKKEEYWQAEETKIASIISGGFEKYLCGIEGHQSAFKLQDTSLRCIDEGTPGGIHLAGSGILLDAATAAKYAESAKVDGVFSHAECGAAKLFAEKENLDPEAADEYGIEWAKTLAERLKVPYKGHIEISQMNRPSGLHDARVVYYDGTGRFDYQGSTDLPKGFVIDRKYLDQSYALQELDVAIQIALGGHGFGDKFTPESPFLAIALTEKNGGLDKAGLLSEAEGIAAKYNNRVSVQACEIDL